MASHNGPSGSWTVANPVQSPLRCLGRKSCIRVLVGARQCLKGARAPYTVRADSTCSSKNTFNNS